MFSKRFVFVVFILAYLSFLIASVPVSLIWQFTSAYVPNTNARFSDFQGTLWQGNVKLSTRGEQFDLDWEVHAARLLLGKLKVKTAVKQSSMQLDAIASINLFGQYHIENISGFIDDRLLSIAGLPRGTEIKGRLWIDSLNIVGGKNQPIDALSGTARWSGGPVQFLAGKTTLNTEVPQLFVELTSTENIQLKVVDANQQEWINGRLDQDGWLNLQVLQNVADVLELPIQSGSQNILFEMKQKLY